MDNIYIKMELLSSLSIIIIGILSSLFVFSSKLITRVCDDEKEFSKKFRQIGRYSILLLAIIISFSISTLFFLILFVVFFIISEFGFYRLDRYYIRRGFSYLLMYIALLINPVLVFLVSILEFFNMIFKKEIKFRFEILLFVGYLITLVVVFLL